VFFFAVDELKLPFWEAGGTVVFLGTVFLTAVRVRALLLHGK
jgi:hypothetical protein